MSEILSRMDKLGKKIQKGSASEMDIIEFQQLYCRQIIIELNVGGTDELAELPKDRLVIALDSMATLMWMDAWKSNPIVMEKETTVCVAK